MSEKKTETEIGFKDIAANLLPDVPGITVEEEVKDDNIPFKSPEEIEEEDKKISGTKKSEESGKKEEEIEDEEGDIDKIAEDENDSEDISKKERGGDKEESEESDFGEYESDIASFFAGRLAEELGWEFGEDEKFESVKDVVELLKKAVEENSKPSYPSEEVEELAKFVENGGDIRDFFSSAYGEVDVENLDLESEVDQKLVVIENFKDLGYSTERINRLVKRYEESGTLKEEAEEAKETLLERREQRKKELVRQQKEQADQIRKEQELFVRNLTTEIKNMKDFYGYSITEKEKEDTLNYLLKRLPDGQTAFQKDYAENGLKNLIDTALFFKLRDKLIKNATKTAENSAAKKLIQKIQESKKDTKRVKGSGTGDDSSADLRSLSGLFIKKP